MPNTPIGKAQLSAQATHPPPFKPPPACADEFEHANYNFQVMLKHESGAPFETTLYMFKQTASAILPLQEHIELIAGVYAITHLPFETVSRFRAFWGRNASPYPKQMCQLIDFRDNIQKVLAQRKSAKVVQVSGGASGSQEQQTHLFCRRQPVDDDDDAAAPVTSTELPAAAAVIDVDAELPAPPGGDSDMEDIDEDNQPAEEDISNDQFLKEVESEMPQNGKDSNKAVQYKQRRNSVGPIYESGTTPASSGSTTRKRARTAPSTTDNENPPQYSADEVTAAVSAIVAIQENPSGATHNAILLQEVETRTNLQVIEHKLICDLHQWNVYRAELERLREIMLDRGLIAVVNA
ncbi:hypothetical protein B0H16DRAFT_1749133 [Mycena metata]|uniref:Uncharacterized protein n=1 Tax=Mycena metata TaxID=1033252 RepID=A0AAD7DVA8_9AGAR|nr:hypothetical protein B0H16DRAFT_1749133 [Mycena metata]